MQLVSAATVVQCLASVPLHLAIEYPEADHHRSMMTECEDARHGFMATGLLRGTDMLSTSQLLFNFLFEHRC